MTPMMKQYLSMKEAYPDCLLFFRLGDFYEMFHADAKVGAEELGLTLTTRDRSKPEEERTPMCGVPYHSAQSYIARLIKRGYKVAICEQLEEAAAAKGLVERDVIRVVTPGTAMEDVMLDEGRNNYICALYQDGRGWGLARCDLSTGQFQVSAHRDGVGLDSLCSALSACPPSEAILSPEAMADGELTDFLRRRLGCLCQDGGALRFLLPQALSALHGCGLWEGEEPAGEEEGLCLQAAGGLAAYLIETQKTELSHLGPLVMERQEEGRYMELDLTARQTLELTETLRGKEKKGSLLWVLDKTRTAMGHRSLRSWLERPLRALPAIRQRQEGVAALHGNALARDELTLLLRQVPDLERLMGRVSYGSANARDMKLLAQGLALLPGLRQAVDGLGCPALSRLSGALDGLDGLRQRLDDTIREESDEHRLPFTIREGDFIRPGFHPEVDRLRDVLEHGADLVMGVESRERERTGIKSLKVRYNKVFGYYIEVSKSYYELVPDDYIRKQTLANCERFITQELKELEHEILSAQSRITALEYQLFCQLREEVAGQVRAVQRAAACVGELDSLLSLAVVAVEQGYCRPEVDDSSCISIRDGRHPVVEKMLQDSLFVPNDTEMDGEAGRLAILTGPNMAGKSTYMRQVALIVLMAQMGSFVPARSARIGLVDRVFTRIGASDDLSAGQSTFMVEMTEVAQMLRSATPDSLLILDEIGRGTSTYDGMAIARAVLEHCADRRRLGCKTLFATHYHELTEVERELDGVRNYHIAARKRKDDIIFLRKIVPGGADQSYGIEVAGLAGVPGPVIRRAREILTRLEEGSVRQPPPAPSPEEEQLSLSELAGAEVLDILRATAVETLTPIEAMNLLYQLKQKL